MRAGVLVRMVLLLTRVIGRAALIAIILTDVTAVVNGVEAPAVVVAVDVANRAAKAFVKVYMLTLVTMVRMYRSILLFDSW